MSESKPKAPARKSAPAQKRTAKVGASVPVSEGGTVMRPNGATHTVVGGAFVADVPGLYVVDGEDVTVK